MPTLLERPRRGQTTPKIGSESEVAEAFVSQITELIKPLEKTVDNVTEADLAEITIIEEPLSPSQQLEESKTQGSQAA